jgi:hypothetical protein
MNTMQQLVLYVEGALGGLRPSLSLDHRHLLILKFVASVAIVGWIFILGLTLALAQPTTLHVPSSAPPAALS